MLWIKTFHIVFVVSWFAGLFYLPRIFVNLAMVVQDIKSADNFGIVKDNCEYERLILMATKLYKFTWPLMVLSIVFGLWLWLGYGIGFGRDHHWMNLKVLCVLVLIAYHLYCGVILKNFIDFKCERSHIWFRWFNEFPVIFLFLTTTLVVVKPF